MNMFAKKLSISLLTVATFVTPLTAGSAYAGEEEFRYHQGQRGWNNPDDNRHWVRPGQSRHGGHRIHRRHHNNNDAIALGIIGLGAAAIIGGAIANSNNPRVIYRQPSAPRAVSGGKYQPWSKSWYRYCSNKFRSFNASTGTYRGYDGRDHFCVAR